MPDVTPERARDFYREARFYRRAPRRSAGEGETIKVECERLEGGPWYAIVPGMGVACISGGEVGQNPHSPGCRPYLSRAKRLGTPTLLVVISEESPYKSRTELAIVENLDHRESVVKPVSNVSSPIAVSVSDFLQRFPWTGETR